MSNVQDNVSEWVLSSIHKIKKDGITRDCHIDELGIVWNRNQEKAFKDCCLIANAVASALTGQEYQSLVIWLHVGLISDSTLFKGLPGSKKEIIESIEVYDIPELIVYQPMNLAEVPVNEFYRAPLTLLSDQLPDCIIPIYKEYRSGFSFEEEYTREINFVFMPILSS